MLTQLRQRIREVRGIPDGLLYLLTDEDDALLSIEPSPREKVMKIEKDRGTNKLTT
ncbi:PQQ-dependent sugar dehydrogenase [Gammaproteobacteria bacterium]|jgi:glucose/arabinose dehydrogenase|nr:PQQ-dependent sugar dehydrogenase [Gammaproteobacteria bacterium]|tara:strand:- start:1012 stop:1179 length:168 start_codon:yes stop_codon:yes gene_type:complete